MASELFKNKALIQRLKEPDVPVVNFNLADSAKDYSIESIIEEVSTPTESFEERSQLAIGGGLFSGTDLGTREGFGGIRYNLKPLGGEGNEYIKTFNTKGGEKKYIFIFSRGGITKKFTAPFTPAGLKEVKKVRAETLEKFKASGFKEKSITKLKNPPNPNKPWRYKTSADTTYFKTEAEAKKAQDKRIKTKFEDQTKIPKSDFEKIKKRILKGDTLEEIAKDYDSTTKPIAKLLSDNNTTYSELTPNKAESKVKGFSAYLNDPKNLNYIKKNYGKLKGETMGKALFPDLPASTQQARIRKLVSKLLSEKEITYTPGAMIEEVKKERGFNPEESARKVQTERKTAKKKFSVPAFERAMQGSKTSQLSHMGDLYNEIVRFETLGYSPQRINQEILKNVDPYLKNLIEKRAKLLKNKPAGYETKVKDINNKGMAVAHATKGYKTFNVIEPNGKSYIIGKEASKSLDPLGMFEGKTLQDIAPKDISRQSSILKQMIPDDVERFIFVENAKAVQEAQAKVSQTEMDKIAKELEEIGFDTDPFFEKRKKKLSALQELSQRTGSSVDPILAARAAKEEFVDPVVKAGSRVLPLAAKGVRGALTAADLALSVGKGTTGLMLGALIEADPILTGMAQGKTFRKGARDTFIGSAIDAIPGVDLGSLGTDLLKLADTEEQKVAVQNLLDYQKDFDKFNKDLRQFREYEKAYGSAFEESGITRNDLINMEKDLIERFTDIQKRESKVFNPDTDALFRSVARKEAKERFENLNPRSFQMKSGSEFIDKQTEQIFNALIGFQGATDSFTDVYKDRPEFNITQQDLDDIYEMGGITGAAEGGRIGFAQGPMNPKRRLFLKLMTGIMALPIVPKFMRQADVAKPIVKLANTTTTMPDWFPDLITKVMFKSSGKKVDADVMLYEVKELPGIKIYKQGDGKIRVEGTNQYGKEYQIDYEPPGYELVDESGKSFKTKGDFSASEDVPVSSDPDGNMDFDVEVLDDLDQILGSDTRIMEEFATGKTVEKMKSGEFAVGKAEADLERAAEEAAEYYDEID